jgi:hypothetical protein
MGTAALPGWLQVVLVGLSGVAGWMLLRPYRRLTQLAGGSSPAAAALAARQRTPEIAAAGAAAGVAVADGYPARRVEIQPDPAAAPVEPPPTVPAPPPARIPQRRMPIPTGEGWTEPVPESSPAFSVYRPSRSTEARPEPAATMSTSSLRAEARRDT